MNIAIPRIISGLIPGLSVILSSNSPRKKLWSIVLICSELLIVLVIAAYLYLTPRETLVGYLTDPPTLLLLLCLYGAVAALWVFFIALGYFLNLSRLSGLLRRFIAGLLTVVLMAVIVIPSYFLLSLGASTYSVLTGTLSQPVEKVKEYTAPVSVPSSSPTLKTFAPTVVDKAPWAGQERVNVLILGSDAGSDRVGVRPDILLVASIDTATGKTALISLPRNLQHPRFSPGSPGAKAWPNGLYFEEGLINSAWTWAENNKSLFPGDPEPGLSATRDIVSNTLGLSIDNSVVVNMEGFEQIVDSLGGVDITVPRRLPIGGGNAGITGYIPAGKQKLDGNQALWFVRSRVDSSDYDRMDRTRCMVGKLTQQASPTQLILSFSGLADAVNSNIYTDVQNEDIKYWTTLYTKVKNSDIESLAFTDALINPGQPDFDFIKKKTAELLDETSASVDITSNPVPTASTLPVPDSSSTDDVPLGTTDTDETVDVFAAC